MSNSGLGAKKTGFEQIVTDSHITSFCQQTRDSRYIFENMAYIFRLFAV